MTTATLTDTDLALRNAIVQQLDRDSPVDASAIAEKAIRYVPGVKGIVDRIRVTPAAPADVKRQIARALHRDADVGTHGLQVSVSGNTAVLAGRVRTWHERESAERAAMHAPGVVHVDNRLVAEAPGGPDLIDEIC